MQDYIEQFWEVVTIEFMVKFFIIYFFFVWMALVLWVARDIWNRSNSRLFQLFCVLTIVCLTPLGFFLYLLIRPHSSVYERYQDEIEENLSILSEIVHERLEYAPWEIPHCYNCESVIENDYLICPDCKTSLKHTCKSCKKEVRTSWDICPYCETKQDKKPNPKKSKKKKKAS